MKRSRAAEALDDGEEAVEVDVAFDGGSVFGQVQKLRLAEGVLVYEGRRQVLSVDRIRQARCKVVVAWKLGDAAENVMKRREAREFPLHCPRRECHTHL